MFELFKQYVLNPEDDLKLTKHSLYKVSPERIQEAEKKILIPYELKLFFREVGYGFFHNKKTSFDRLLAPLQLVQINFREDFYEFDPDLELYEDDPYKDKLIFFELTEGVYLLINKQDINGRNAIYYFDKKIADSLEEFLIKFDREGHYFESE